MKPSTEKAWTKLSKFLSFILRHKPELIDIKLDQHGWISTEELIQKCQKHGQFMDMKTLEYLVQNNSKQRFAFNGNKNKIRANQGHSVVIDLALDSVPPPMVLYHGTAQKYISSIQKEGLQKRNRHHVHLSSDLETAKKVGARHGKVVILTIATKKMADAAYSFYLTENGVWLTDHVPVEFIQFEAKK